MNTETHLTVSATRHRHSSEVSQRYLEGIVAGVIGAATIAIWFLILDAIYARPLYTPTVLGTALFRHGEGLSSPGNLPISLEMTWMYTWVHGLAFCVIGEIASRLLVWPNRIRMWALESCCSLYSLNLVSSRQRRCLRSLSFMR